MSGKTAIRPLVADHLRTFRDDRTGKRRLRDYLVHFAAPAALAALGVALGLRLADAAQIIAGAAVLAGFSFGLAVFVFQLRLDAGRDPRVPKGSTLLELIDELFNNVLYSIVIGLALVVAVVAATSFTAPPPGESPAPLSGWWTAGVVALGLHYILTLLMCLKRTRAAYKNLTI